MSEKYDLIIIGGGPAGLAAAAQAAFLQKRALVIEKEGWGGTCTHRGCVPTKALLSCSKYFADLKKLKRAGIDITGATFDFSAIKRHQQQIVKIAAMGAQKTAADAGVDIKTGTAEITAPGEVKVVNSSGTAETFSAKNIIIAWGSEPALLPGIKLSSRVLTSDGALALNTLPRSVIIIGGSFIGIEFATFFAELGVEVSLLELLDRLLPNEDAEAASFLQQELARSGIAIHTSARYLSMEETATGVTVAAEKDSASLQLNADCVVICTGRKPLLAQSQLAKLGIDYGRSGIKIKQDMQTNVPGIYAAGDVTGGMMLAHRADRQARAAVLHICGRAASYNEHHIPSVVYSHPPVAHVGWRQQQAAEAGLEVSIARATYSANIMARAELAGQGFVKALFHQNKLIGATIAGEQAAELISPLSLAVANRMTRAQLNDWVIPHPTLSEIFTSLFSN